jgi:endonuclease III
MLNLRLLQTPKMWYNPAVKPTQPESHELPPGEKVKKLYEVLAPIYGELEWQPTTDPLSELILTILSQHTSDLNRDRAFHAMRERFPTWEEVRDASTHELADAIRSGGLANIKAPRIQEVLKQLSEVRDGKLDLDFLMEMPVDEAKAYLAGFNGVGPKTAACVLMFACGMPVLPVDTHVYRVSGRLGLIDRRSNADKAHTELDEIVEPEDRYNFHIFLIKHGRQVCKAQHPLCDLCAISHLCDYYNTDK